ncbi:uncharacterized protein F4807DRAFT_463179 [Annulohypoxylon truncatum]|uniref:uncharacterized protein n=1 Tax=Annulohypoxylon truncatum TaxID=327061 RepID=UPI00200875E0|nr:uncharacterized protein F4807DRAFT_463179 [Annulohypoxylon truncatum]KAI1206775.1 hypothetical protein F4807DRAFT_463179 [Annulohypoxylon truncatum]
MPSRTAPCRRCLASLQSWKGGQLVICQDDDSGSTKCTRCRRLNKTCVVPIGPLKARATALAQALATANGGHTDAVKAAQTAVKKAIQGQKNAAALPAHKASDAEKLAATEREERQLIAQERLVDAVEKVGNTLAALLEAYEGVHANILNPPSPSSLGELDDEAVAEAGPAGENV